MTIKEIENFCRQDQKKYELRENMEFINWYKDIQRKGYTKFMKLDEMQFLINNIVIWYELKYPDRALKIENGIKEFKFKNIEKIQEHMNTKQLLYRLQDNQITLLEGLYRGSGVGHVPIYQNGRKVDEEDAIFVRLVEKEKKDDFSVLANSKTGNIYSNVDLRDYIGEMKVNLEGLLYILKENYADELDSNELEKVLFNHECDLELRNKLLQLVALKILYSKNTKPEYGYIRAERFIEEFNNSFNLALSDDEITAIIEKDYNTSNTIYVFQNNLTIKRKYELEKYLKKQIELHDLSEEDYNYLEFAKKLSLENILSSMNFYRDNASWISHISLSDFIMREYACTKDEAERRIDEVKNIIIYEKNKTKELIHTQKKMVKKMQKYM